MEGLVKVFELIGERGGDGPLGRLGGTIRIDCSFYCSGSQFPLDKFFHL